MLLSTTTYSLQVKGYTYEEITELLVSSGFDALDFSFVVPGYFGEETETEAFTQGLLRLKGLAEDRGLVLNQAHAPYASAAAMESDPNTNVANVTRAMRQAAMMGIGTIVCHPVNFVKYDAFSSAELIFERNMEYFRRLKPYCEEYGIRIAIENSWQYARNKKIVAGACADPEEHCRYIDTLGADCFAACLDIGHALLNSDPVRCIRTLGRNRLKALHVHDTDGFDDSHTLPGLGIGNWDAITGALRQIDYEGDFTFEADLYQLHMPKAADREVNALLAKVGRSLMAKMKTDVN